MNPMGILRRPSHHLKSNSYKPDFERFIRACTTNDPGPVPFGEIFADHETVGNYLGERVFDYARMAADPLHRITPRDLIDGLRYIDQTIRFCLAAEWDYAYSFSVIPFPGFTYDLAQNTSKQIQVSRQRYWVNDNSGPIQSWNDFEHYPWPKNMHTVNLSSRLMAKRMPDGMKVMVIPGGVFEWTTWLFGLTPFCYLVVDEPDLVDAVIQKVSDSIYAVIEGIIAEPGIGGVFMGDDLGFTSGTIVSPNIIRNKFLPHTQRMVELVHQAGKIFVFHSCGNLEKIMDDICDIGVDAKHSFEDKIMPVEEVYRRWSNRISIIGGVDIHLLASGTEDEVRVRTREILDHCGRGGRYVLGTGNSVANYIPLSNYFAMLDEGRRWNKAHFPHH
jgi:uroporphyrinogen decarboxylase